MSITGKNWRSSSALLIHASATLFLWLGALPAAAQNQNWIRQFGTSIRGDSDQGRDSAPDGVGGVFVGGGTAGGLGGANAGGDDAWLAHYDGDGKRTWIRQFGSSSNDHTIAVAPDGSGGVYQAGITQGSLGGPSAGSWDSWLSRHDGAGNQLWILQLGTSGSDQVELAAPDGAGGVYVGGVTDASLGESNAGGLDAWLARYDGLGSQLWIVQLGTGSDEVANAAAADGAGGAYVGGLTFGALGGAVLGNGDAWLARYDGAGNQTWIRQFGTNEGEGVDVATPDGAGGVHVGGATSGDLGGPNQGSDDTWLARYDGAGNQAWIRQFGTSSDDLPLAAAPDGSGGMHVGGTVVGGWASGTGWLARCDGSGDLLWIRLIVRGSIDNLFGAAPDGAGGVFVTGDTYGSPGGPGVIDVEAWVARYDDAGNQTWVLQFGASDREGVAAAAPDEAGGVYVGGVTDGSFGAVNPGDADAWLARHDGAGNSLWVRQLGSAAADFVGAAATDGAGGVFVGGTTEGSLGGPSSGARDGWLARYDGAGNPLWILQIGTGDDDSLDAAAPDESGGAYVAGTTNGSLGAANAGLSDVWLARHDSSGNPLWVLQLGTTEDDSVLAAAADGAGGVYLGGETRGSLGAPNAGDADAWLAHYDSAGNQIWILQLGTAARDSLAAAVPDVAEGVYVGGESHGSLGAPNAGDADAWLARYDGAGNQLWIHQLGTSARDSVTAAAPKLAGGLVVGGETYGSLGAPNAGEADAWLARYDGAGNQSWIRQLGTLAHDSLAAAALDTLGGIFVGGFTDGWLVPPGVGGRDAWLAHYDADTMPPVLHCPSSVSVLDSNSGPPGAVVYFTVTATDDVDPAPSVTCVPPSGSFFPRGRTRVTCTATDESGRQSVCSFPVFVMPKARRL